MGNPAGFPASHKALDTDTKLSILGRMPSSSAGTLSRPLAKPYPRSHQEPGGSRVDASLERDEQSYPAGPAGSWRHLFLDRRPGCALPQNQ